jgi:AraC family transcriptional regulator of adaptative response / DNA-3-methyladenine glycosylase II
LRELARALTAGEVTVDPGADREETGRRLRAIRGIGPWTASYVAMRALGDPDVLPASDLGVRRAVERLGRPGDPISLVTLAERWRPWRSYATQYLWASPNTRPSPEKGAVA